MADQRGSLGDPVAFVLPKAAARWPLWTMMALGLYLSSVPLSYGWASETAVSCGLLGGLTVFGLALFSRLHEPLSQLAYLNAFVGAGAFALMALGGLPGPIWLGPLLVGCAMAARASATFPNADVPPGGFFNPSASVQRLPAAGMAVLGALGARGGRGPAAWLYLGALALVLIGDRKRWRTAPWSVCSCGLAGAAALAAAGLQLVSLPSPAATAAVLAGALFGLLSMDEWRATLFFLRHAPQLGQGAWDAFWGGGSLPEDSFAPRPSRRAAWAPPRAFGRRHGRRRQSGLIRRFRRATGP